MLTLHSRLYLNEQEIAAKVIDGEAIIINLATGNYYSMDNVGAFTWEKLAVGHSLQEVATAISAHYEVLYEHALTDVERLTTELLQEGLLTESDTERATEPLVATESQQRLPYAPPVLNIYRDMGDLLALDPPTPGLQDLTWKEPDDK
jgi:hypothetical protein